MSKVLLKNCNEQSCMSFINRCKFLLKITICCLKAYRQSQLPTSKLLQQAMKKKIFANWIVARGLTLIVSRANRTWPVPSRLPPRYRQKLPKKAAIELFQPPCLPLQRSNEVYSTVTSICDTKSPERNCFKLVELPRKSRQCSWLTSHPLS